MELEFQWLGRMKYNAALQLQESLVRQRLGGEIPNRVLLLEHEPVYTIGRTRDRSSLRDPDALPHPLVEISRGGQATYHGPGQLVGYLILDLRELGQDLHKYLRAVEDALLSFCQSLGLSASRREGLTGTWIGERKIASIGVGVRHWISLHGFALNIGGPLNGFSAITPCGIQEVEMTSLEKEGVTHLDVVGSAVAIRPHLEAALKRLQEGCLEESISQQDQSPS